MKLRGRNAGFTIVEVLMTLAIVAIVVTVAFDLTNASGQTNSRTKVYAEANSQAFGKLQDYETRSFDNIPVGDASTDYVVEDFAAEVTTDSEGVVKNPDAKVYVQYEPGSGSLLKVRVVLIFDYANSRRTIEYATYIQLGGVGR